MAITIPGSITGGTQTGFTSPTYTTAVDVAPSINGKQSAITALGGTQVGVTAHSISAPFTVTFTRPSVMKMLPSIGQNGQYANVPNNVSKLLTRKGVTPAVNQPTRVAMISTEFSIPAGSETYDAANVRAAIAAHIGLLNGISAGLGDTVVNGVM